VISEINILIDIERKFSIKTIHNELKIIKVISENTHISSMDICIITGRSISAHNADLKRLTQLKIVYSSCDHNDKRRRIYSLTPIGQNLVSYFMRKQNSLDEMADL